MGKKLIIANWKMNLSIGEASLFVHKLAQMIEYDKSVEVVLAPSSIALQSISLQAHNHHFKLAAQNFYWRDSGAFTGEVSANQLRGLVQYGIVGHSERRHIFMEHDRDIRNKVQAAYRHGFTPVLCIGETAHERALNETVDVLHDQLIGGLSNITSDEASKLVIAYEPVWSIGTGDFAKPSDVEAAVKAIRSQVRHLFGAEVAKKVRILYGGSVNKDNAGSFLEIKGIDGLLVGGASLEAHTFAAIVNRAKDEIPRKGKK